MKQKNFTGTGLPEGINLTPRTQQLAEREMELSRRDTTPPAALPESLNGIYHHHDAVVLGGVHPQEIMTASLQTLDELLERDKQREKDGFSKRIRLGKFVKPGKDRKEQIVVVPTTTEPKFYHDPSEREEEQGTGGSGEGEEGEVIGEQQGEPQQGEGDDSGAGQGKGGEHDIGSDAFDLGKILTEKFELPNLKVKGKKPSLTRFQYELTDRNRGFGQILDKKASAKKIIETNILLGNIRPDGDFDPSKLVINPQDKIYRILSKEKDFESQAVVFFIRDYSGSMQGKPTETVVTQHLLIYSWLMYQYHNQVMVRFILHDTEAKEVPDFYTYYRSAVAGGTTVYPSYELVMNIIEKEQLARDYNIYIFHGTDGDDWEEDGEKALAAVGRLLMVSNRMGITIAKNAWAQAQTATVVEEYFDSSGLLKEKSQLLRLDAFMAEEASESRIIEGIRKLIS